FRKYVESDKLYLEVKFKSNKGRTVKERISRTNIKPDFKGRSGKLIEKITNIDPSLLKEKLLVCYSRITLVSNDLKERVTIDTNLTFKTENSEKLIQDLVIGEVKQDKLSLNSEFVQLMRTAKIQPMRISKYCIGAALMYNKLKQNRFKPKLLMLNKIAYGNIA
ncbi:VTC domain-containing protein, partial [Bacteroidales bacterium AH-315-N07]|nr:VTC domain-containing protein [Bacteroidales bacterium AH-315-N07]